MKFWYSCGMVCNNKRTRTDNKKIKKKLILASPLKPTNTTLKILPYKDII